MRGSFGKSSYKAHHNPIYLSAFSRIHSSHKQKNSDTGEYRWIQMSENDIRRLDRQPATGCTFLYAVIISIKWWLGKIRDDRSFLRFADRSHEKLKNWWHKQKFKEHRNMLQKFLSILFSDFRIGANIFRFICTCSLESLRLKCVFRPLVILHPILFFCQAEEHSASILSPEAGSPKVFQNDIKSQALVCPANIPGK